MSNSLSARGIAALSVLLGGAAAASAQSTEPGVFVVGNVFGPSPTSTPLPLPQGLTGTQSAVSIGLLLPAVQKIREAATRVERSGPDTSKIVVVPLDNDPEPIPGPFEVNTGGAPFIGIRAHNETVGVGASSFRRTRSLVVAPGPGSNQPVQEIRLAAGQPVREFSPYGSNFRGGVHIATGDLNGDGVDDIVTGAGPGGGPHVKAYDGNTLEQFASFFAYDPLKGGDITLAVGDVNGDGTNEVIVGSEFDGPQVHIYKQSRLIQSGPTNTVPIISPNYAYNLPESFVTSGVYCHAGDLNGDGIAEVIANPFGTPKPGTTRFDSLVLQFAVAPIGGGLEGFTTHPLLNPFGPDYTGSMVAVPADLDPRLPGDELVMTAFSGLVPEPGVALSAVIPAALLLSRKRRC